MDAEYIYIYIYIYVSQISLKVVLGFNVGFLCRKPCGGPSMGFRDAHWAKVIGALIPTRCSCSARLSRFFFGGFGFPY